MNLCRRVKLALALAYIFAVGVPWAALYLAALYREGRG